MLFLGPLSSVAPDHSCERPVYPIIAALTVRAVFQASMERLGLLSLR